MCLKARWIPVAQILRFPQQRKTQEVEVVPSEAPS